MASNETIVYPTGDGFIRFTSEGFCPSKPFISFLDGLLSKFDDANFFTNVLQFGLVSLMYFNVGKGRYWKILFYAGIAGLIGTLIEKSSIAYVCRKSDIHNERPHIYGFFLAEVFWIVKEYAIPFLNLTKMKVFSKGKASHVLNIIIYGLFIAFVGARFYIGYRRYKDGVLNNTRIKYGHMVAFSIMAIADLICTLGILYFVNTHNKQEYIKANNIDHYIKRSSYIILLCVDVVSVFLAILNGITEHYKEQFPNSFVKPFHSIKCSFILILACDALLFKYSVNTSSARDSNNYRYGEYNTKSHNYNYEASMNKSQNNPLASVTPYNYPTLDYGKSDSISGSYQSKSIIKNYTNIKPSPSSTLYDASPGSDKILPSQSFGFLYQSNGY